MQYLLGPVPLNGIWDLLLVTLFLLLITGPKCQCFNVDTDSTLMYTKTNTHSRSSYFGYSVTQHIDSGGVKSIVAGAPRANTSQQSDGITEAGEVYKCSLSTRLSSEVLACRNIIFDTTGDEKAYDGVANYLPIERKSYQWFGATVASQRNGAFGSIMGCAPRYVFKSRDLDKMAVVGKCMIKGSTEDTVSPAKTGLDADLARRVRNRGFAQFGMSGAMSEDGQVMAAGAVGSYNWRGQLYTHNLTANGKKTHSTLKDPDISVQNTTYRGYAVALGHFSLLSAFDFVVSLPRGNQMMGEVEIYNSDLSQPICRLKGKQIGEYFGTALVVADFNNDGQDDLAVGAPFFYRHGSNYETGRVFIFYLKEKQLGKCVFESKASVLEGRRTVGERFGFAMTAVGDINMDGFTDLAVGAPYGGATGQGSVYIFHGSRKGIKTKFSQVIDASSITSPYIPLQTFGFSLSGGIDLDNNRYPDIVVGAYASDSIIQLWSRPVIKLTIETTTNRSAIDVDEPNTVIEDTPVSSFAIHACIKHSGVNVASIIGFKIHCRIGNEDDLNPRAFLILPDNYQKTEHSFTVTTPVDSKQCLKWNAYIRHGIRDKLTPIPVNITVEMVEGSQQGSPHKLTGVLDPDIPAQQIMLVNIEKDCGADEICVPDLRLTADPKTKSYMLGSEKSDLEIEVLVENRVEDEAFEAVLEIVMPEGTTYRKIGHIQSPVKIRCNIKGGEGAGTLLCDLGNPFPGNSQASFTLVFTPQSINGSVDQLEFILRANSSNQEKDTSIDDNTAIASINIEAEVGVQFSGVSNPEQILYNSSLSKLSKSQKNVGPDISHLYQIWNQGPSTIQEAKILIFWPSFLDNGDDFLYPLNEVPEVTKSPGGCFVLRNAINGTDKRKRDLKVPSSTKIKTRHRRDSSFFDDLKLTGQSGAEKKYAKCTTEQEPWCTIFQCDIGPLAKEEESVIEVKAKLWLKSIVQLNYQAIVASSLATAEVVSLPYAENVIIKKPLEPVEAKVDTYLAATDVGAGRGGVEIWVVAVSVIGGLTLLALLIFILHKCGFFRRSKVNDDEVEDEIGLADDRVSKRQSGIDTVNRKLIFKNGVSISIEEKAYKNF